jgi:hypothetical protein
MHGNMNVKFKMAFVKLVIHYKIGGSLTITSTTIYSNEHEFRCLSAMCYLCIHLYELSCICLFICLFVCGSCNYVSYYVASSTVLVVARLL